MPECVVVPGAYYLSENRTAFCRVILHDYTADPTKVLIEVLWRRGKKLRRPVREWVSEKRFSDSYPLLVTQDIEPQFF